MLYVSQFKSKKRKIGVAEHSLMTGSWVVTTHSAVCSVALCNNRLSHFVINLKWMVGGQGTTTTTIIIIIIIEIIITVITIYSFQFHEKLSSDTFYRWSMSHNVVFNGALYKN